MGCVRTSRAKEDDMRRGLVIGVTLLVIAAGILIGVGAYHAGVNHGLDQAENASRIVRVEGPGYGFPFGLLLFPLVIFGFFAIAGSFRRRRWAAYGGPGRWGGGPGHWGGPGKFGFDEGTVQEWHRRLHEESEHTSAGGEPSTA
jgi:hypothetical protein